MTQTPTSSKQGLIDQLGRLIEKIRAKFGSGGPAADLAEPMTSQDPQRYLDPAAIARFGLNPFVAKLVVEGFINGLHKSPFHGFSVEFADHREYVPGDDLKYLDWALYARTDHYYIKRYEEETNLRCYVLLDNSASMGFGTGKITKWDYACFLAMCMSYMMIKQQDAVGLSLFGSKPGIVLPPKSRNTHLRQMMQVMIKNPPTGQTDLPSSLRAIINNLKRRGMVIVISDLIDDPEQTVKALKMLSGHGHDVIVFHVHDAAELEFTFQGSTLFRDMETGEEIEVDPVSIRDAYKAKMAEVEEFYRKKLSMARIDYHPINTRTPYDQALAAYLQRRIGTRR
jgi:uncharacterized protein (DUF58 family)